MEQRHSGFLRTLAKREAQPGAPLGWPTDFHHRPWEGFPGDKCRDSAHPWAYELREEALREEGLREEAPQEEKELPMVGQRRAARHDHQRHERVAARAKRDSRPLPRS